MALSPLDAALTHAASVVLATTPAYEHSSAQLDVAMAPGGTTVRLNGKRADLPEIHAAWDALRVLLRDAWPALSWPVGFRLDTKAQSKKWNSWRVSEIYLFGQKGSAKHLGLDWDRVHWNWRDQPIGLDAAGEALRALEARVPASNGSLRAFSEGHNMMNTPYIHSSRVIARSEAEALAKMAWIRHGLPGITALFEKPEKRFSTWLVAAELADPERDGFAKPQQHTDALEALRRLSGA